MPNQIEALLSDIRACTLCQEHLPLGPNPVLQTTSKARIAVIGQAPGIRVHQSGIPWNDPSGDRLRKWLNVGSEDFYNPDLFAIIPMGFCYPGTGKSGDLPPRKECAKTWHDSLFRLLPNIDLTLLIGKYAQDYYLKEAKKNLTENCMHFEEFLPAHFPLPHPSPRNNIWIKKNPWFEKGVLPSLQSKTEFILSHR